MWALGKDSVRELWLFGSHGTDLSKASEVQLALALQPPRAKTDWALGKYAALGDMWQRELEMVVGRHVSLAVIRPGTSRDRIVRATGVLLCAKRLFSER
jgi:hypothetical protein